MNISGWPLLAQAFVLVLLITGSSALVSLLPGLELQRLLTVGFTTGMVMALMFLMEKKSRKKP